MQKITTPTLLLDEGICKANIRRMAEKAQHHNLRFKPHMKTHQSAQVGEWIKDAGVTAITVSSIDMAHYFAQNGWKDITIAFPCNVGRTQELNKLAQNITLTLLINKPETAHQLETHLTSTLNTYIEIDTGSARSGLASDDIRAIKELITVIQKTKFINWVGFYSHAGHSYSCRSEQEISEVQHSIVKQFNNLKKCINPDFGTFEICSGDTPCCSVANNFGPIDAISPGNFVFYDLMQTQIGSCTPTDIAVAMVCPVVDKYPKRNELIIHGGAVHFSKESMTKNGLTHYGAVAQKIDNHWKPLDTASHLVKLSQEHGVICCSDVIFKSYDIGDAITILPIHSCLTANLMSQYQLTDKNGTQVNMM
ncbi:alanine racemase [Aliifodinibius salipaludis]|uniref:Alanine racemase n=1 Tax=Fodinibius salipaludis TaxID=2032627 RepID=A0A2A2GAI2_9BACT|nr:alanine racemase [Aliifodinibius salipaludis]PAU93859.1 alanine racemase [Aliifodinibius salipaludis]